MQQALGHPGKIDPNLVSAQEARRILDRVVGYPLSNLLGQKVTRGLSAGRVQSVAVRLIVEREREIEAFKAEEYWKILALLAPLLVNASKATDFSLLDARLVDAELHDDHRDLSTRTKIVRAGWSGRPSSAGRRCSGRPASISRAWAG